MARQFAGPLLFVPRCALVQPSVPALIAVEPLNPLPPFLRLERQRRRRSRQQPRNADRLAGFLAIAVTPAVDHLQRLFDFLEQLALAIAGPQLERVFLFERGAIRRVGGDLVLAQMLAGIVGVGQQLRAKLEQALLEKSELRLVHVFLVRRFQKVFLAQLPLLLDLFGGLFAGTVLAPAVLPPMPLAVTFLVATLLVATQSPSCNEFSCRTFQ